MALRLAWLALAIAVFGTVYLRIKGLHLTEGELLVAYWPAWMFIVALGVIAAVLASKFRI